MVIFTIKGDYSVEVSGSFMKKRKLGMACFPDLLRTDLTFNDYAEVNQEKLFMVKFFYNSRI